MSEVFIDDSSLNDIANALRQKNGLVRTYKPREMPPAIRALKEFVPSTHGYAIRIQQSEHQTITVRVFQDNRSQTFDRSFTVGEPLWKFEAKIEADAGWVAGTLNYNGTFSIDRDYSIHAQPATLMTDSTVTVYMNGARQGGETGSMMGSNYHAFSDRECTHRINRSNTYATTLFIQDVSNGYPYNAESLIGGDNPFSAAITIQQNIDVSKKVDMNNAISGLTYCKRIDLSNWNMSNVETMVNFARNNTSMQTYGDISHWYMPELYNANQAFYNNNKLESLDLHDWYCPKLERCAEMFRESDKLYAVDISGLSTNKLTTCSEMFTSCPYLKYIIMDRDEVMFSTEGYSLFTNPNNNVKYLVPDNYVDAYKANSKWASRADRIDSINNYTIDRYGGHVYVTPNI